ncbi:MAG TPA: glycosyltransferase [Ignavibacteriaceae bacterium]|nr:glycosyltransferase [Ignavibacteriaceae bacterium]
MISNSLGLILLLSAFLLFLLHYLFFLQRIFRGLKNLTLTANEKLPYEFISIIIPFRNEEENILASLKSIESQFYPQEKFEVIYVDDSSEDNSFELLKTNIKKNNIIVLSVPNEFSINAHKKRAVRYGIENAKGDIIVTTDADCVHDEEWLKSLVLSFDSVTGFVSGPVEFETDDGLFSEFQKLEFAGLVLCGAGLIGSGHPTICNAANIAYRKKVFDEVGGFKDQMNLSSGDDELLMQKIAKDSDFKVKFCIDKKAIVKTSANKTIGEFYQQRKRWASKGLFYNNKSLVLKLILIYAFYVGLIAQLILGLFYHPIFLLSFLGAFLFKFIFEFRILYKGKEILFNNLQLKYLFIAEIFQIPYIIFTGLVGAFGNYLWKARKVKR